MSSSFTPLFDSVKSSLKVKKNFPLLKIGGRGSRKLGVDRGGPPGLAAGGKYERSHMAKAQKLTSPKRT